MAAQLSKPPRSIAARLAAASLACVALCVLLVHAAYAEEHEIDTRASQWVPVVLFVAPGDSIVFRGMSSHETELIAGMGPAGAAQWQSELDEEGFTITLTEPGAYIYKCHVHMNAGMVGAIVVGGGEPRNLGALKAALPDVELGRAFVERVIGRLERELRRRRSR